MGELDRIRREYTRRAQDPELCERYSPFHQDALFALQTRERVILRMLQGEGYRSLAGFELLEVGCGHGGVLLDLLRWGADPSRLHGCDLLSERVAIARRRLPPSTSLSVADGCALPYPDARFELVLLFTVLTSVLDETLRRSISQEVWRVLRPGGAILLYDFRYQGPNRAVRAIHPREMESLFPEGELRHQRVTLAPPIARRLARWSWLGSELLHVVPWLRTHDVLLIRRAEARYA